jgi:hypothetical protein
MKTLKCKKCGVTVKDKTIIKHMWAAHRAHMMKNHTGGVGAKTKKAAAPAGKKIDGRTLQGRKLAAAEKQRLAAALVPPPSSSLGTVFKKHSTLGFLAGAAPAGADAHLRSTFVANGKKLTVVVHQGQNKIELANVTLVEMFE